MLDELPPRVRAIAAMLVSLVATTVGSGTGPVGTAATGAPASREAPAATRPAGGTAPGAAARSAPSPRLSGAVRGRATHYGPAATGGACSFPELPPGKLGTAVGPSLFQAAGGCGAVLDVTGPGGRIRVLVDNLCPECGPGHVDLTDEAFARLAPLGRGLIPVTSRIVRNPPLRSGLGVRVKEGSSAYWLAVLVTGHGNSLRRVSVRVGGGWRSLARTDYNYWIAPSGLGGGPFTLRVEDVEGHRVSVPGVRLAPGVLQRTSVRMY